MTVVTDNNIKVGNETNRSAEEYTPDHFVRKPFVTKKVPHYLRASTGSCHDACKYGHPHKIKEKPMRPARKRISTPLADGEKTIGIQIYVDKKVQEKVQPDNVEFPSAKELAPANGSLRNSLPSSRRSPVHVSSKLVKQGSYVRSTSPKVPKMITKVVQSSGKSSFMSDTSKIPKHEADVKKNASTKRIPLYPKERNALVGPLKLNGRVVKPPSLSDTCKTSNPEVSSVPRNNVSSMRIPLDPRRRNGSEASIKPNGRGEKQSSVDPFARSASKQTSETGVAVVKTAVSSASKVEVKRPFHSTTAGIGLRGQRQGTQVSAKINNLTKKAELKEAADDHKEKTLHTIETKEVDLLKAHEDVLDTPNTVLLVKSPSPLSPESLNSSSQTDSPSFTSHDVDDDKRDLDSEYTDSEADGSFSNYNCLGDSKPVDCSKEGKEQINGSKGSLKLNFRKGTVIDNESETNSPRKLKFRQGRTLGDDEDTNGGTQRKCYKKQAAEIEKTEADAGVVKVVLKHQEMEMKKDEQVLLNNVIEETASKLVEKRKSKVKALVGAFESVISLQERKPSIADR